MQPLVHSQTEEQYEALLAEAAKEDWSDLDGMGFLQVPTAGSTRSANTPQPAEQRGAHQSNAAPAQPGLVVWLGRQFAVHRPAQ